MPCMFSMCHRGPPDRLRIWPRKHPEGEAASIVLPVVSSVEHSDGVAWQSRSPWLVQDILSFAPQGGSGTVRLDDQRVVVVLLDALDERIDVGLVSWPAIGTCTLDVHQVALTKMRTTFMESNWFCAAYSASVALASACPSR